MVSRFGTETSPSSGISSPTTMRNRVVLPAPFGPTRPTFSLGLSWNDASTKTNCLPYCLLILEKEIICIQANRTERFFVFAIVNGVACNGPIVRGQANEEAFAKR